jgi:dihydrolipoamide dehydrogenase
MQAERYGAILLGRGPGGYAGAIRLQQLGIRTLVVEREAPGGVCLNWRCIPSKALFTAARQCERVRGSEAMKHSVGKAIHIMNRRPSRPPAVAAATHGGKGNPP